LDRKGVITFNTDREFFFAFNRMKRRTQRRRRTPKTRKVRKGLVFMGGEGYTPDRKPISNFVIGKFLKNRKGNQLNEINALTNRSKFLISIGLSLAEYNNLSQVQKDYIDSMYNNPDLSNNEKSGIRNYYKEYLLKSNNDKQKENVAYEQY
jgi:hypothetical protein